MAIALVTRAAEHGSRDAIADADGTHSYDELLRASANVAAALLDGHSDLAEARVAFLVPPGFEYAAVQWGIWRAGGIAVPLAVSDPPRELAHVIDEAAPTAIVTHPDLTPRVRAVAEHRGIRTIATPATLERDHTALPDLDERRRALMLFTSGTTGKPKGVVTTHANLRAQVTSLIEAWGWTADDRTLLVLPLHHVHGIVNVLTCALWAGASCETVPAFDAHETWRRLRRRRFSVFMAVPTIYGRLCAAWEAASEQERAAMTAACQPLRLTVSGSAALPADVRTRWLHLSGHSLLERYGMTETGMVLSQPLRGERRPGLVGTALPGISVRLVDEDRRDVDPGAPGELLVKGAGVFLEYWHHSDETKRAFHQGWFMTGDVAVQEHGQYRLLGRRSVDIIKTGGYKVSALEIENALSDHPSIESCAVVGVPDAEWGERVCVAVEADPDCALNLAALRAWAADRLAPYKIPQSLACVSVLPRNAMGKVVKRDVSALFRESEGASEDAP